MEAMKIQYVAWLSVFSLLKTSSLCFPSAGLSAAGPAHQCSPCAARRPQVADRPTDSGVSRRFRATGGARPSLLDGGVGLCHLDHVGLHIQVGIVGAARRWSSKIGFDIQEKGKGPLWPLLFFTTGVCLDMFSIGSFIMWVKFFTKIEICLRSRERRI